MEAINDAPTFSIPVMPSQVNILERLKISFKVFRIIVPTLDLAPTGKNPWSLELGGPDRVVRPGLGMGERIDRPERQISLDRKSVV